MMGQAVSEFRNASAGVCGVVTYREGKQHGIAVRPGDSVWLTEEEQKATANAPRRDEDNPFANGTLVLLTPKTAVANRRPIGDTSDQQVPLSDEAKAEIQKREAEETKRQQAEQERLERGRQQADQPAKPVEETGASVSPQGQPVHGKRAQGEETGV